MSIQMDTSRRVTPEAPATAGRQIIPVLLAFLAAFLFGALGYIFLHVNWLAGIQASLSGAEPHVFWDLSRATAFVAFVLVWLSMVLGLGITNKLARLWPGGPAATDLHEYTSLLG